jgi:hypothetical protein
MRRITHSSNSDRVFGNRQDRQAVVVAGNARSITVSQRLSSKRQHGHDQRAKHLLQAAAASCFAVWANVTDWLCDLAYVGPMPALCYPARVEANTGRRA